jgi:hypothetical protein
MRNCTLLDVLECGARQMDLFTKGRIFFLNQNFLNKIQNLILL